MNRDVYLSSEDLKNLKKYYLSEGSDGKVYKINNDTLYKIYHTENENVTINNEEETKVVKSIKDINVKELPSLTLNFIDKEGTRIGKEDAILKATSKQKNVHLTSLPMGCIYVNGHFRGCVLKYHNHSFPLYQINMLPKKLKLKTVKYLLLEIEELLNNNIYHIDLANKPSFNDKKPHSNVLVKYNLYPEVIDIDGKSAVYRETYDEQYYYKCMLSLKSLLLELLCDVDDIIALNDEDIEYLKYSVKDDELKSNLFEAFENEDTDIKDIKKIFKL